MRDSKKKPLNVHLYVTPVCNLHCKHCYYEAWGTDRVPNDVISLDQIAHAIITLCDRYDVDMHMEGGEMFLRQDLQRLFQMVPDLYWRYVTMTTNGVVKLNVSYDSLRLLGDLRISVEGHTDEINYGMRGVLLRPILQTCTQLRDNEVPFTYRITLHKKNFKHFESMIRFFTQEGSSRFSFFEFQPVGWGTDSQDEYGMAEAELEQVIQYMASTPVPADVETLKLSISPSRVHLVDRNRSQLESQGYEVIKVGGDASITINANGDLGIDPWMVKAGYTPDRFANLANVDLGGVVAEQMEEGSLYKYSVHVSEVQVRFKR